MLIFGSCANYNFLQRSDIEVVKDLSLIPTPKNYYDYKFNEKSTSLNLPVHIQPFEIQYIVQKKDQLSLAIWNHPDLSVGATFDSKASSNTVDRYIEVDQNGMALFPKIGLVKIEGKNLSEAANIVTTKYAEWLRDPQLVLRVVNKKVTVLGAVQSPGNYMLEENFYSLGELLGLVGGTGQFADTKKVKLVREGIAYQFDLTKINESVYQKFKIFAEDVIYIPENANKGKAERATGIMTATSIIGSLALLLSVLGRNN